MATRNIHFVSEAPGGLPAEDVYADNLPSDGGEAPTADTLEGATATGKALMKATDAEAARTAIGAGTSSFSGSYNNLTDKPTIPTIPGNATSSAAGLMSASDKAKLDGIATGANNYSLPAAATGAIGGVRMAAHVASAAGDNVPAAEFEALLDALEAAGIVAGA